jgi:hypothetical protein
MADRVDKSGRCGSSAFDVRYALVIGRRHRTLRGGHSAAPTASFEPIAATSATFCLIKTPARKETVSAGLVDSSVAVFSLFSSTQR